MFYDTRLISGWTIYANGEEWELLNGAALTHFAARIFLTNPASRPEEGEIAEHTLSLAIGALDREAASTRISTSRTTRRKRVLLQPRDRDPLRLRRHLRGQDRPLVRRGLITTEWSDTEQRLRTAYVNEDFRRSVCRHRAAQARCSLRQRPHQLRNRSASPGEAGTPACSTNCRTAAHVFAAARVPRAGRGHRGRRTICWIGARMRLKLQTSNEEFYRLLPSGDGRHRRAATADRGERHHQRHPCGRAAVVRGAVRTRQPDRLVADRARLAPSSRAAR